MIQQSLGRLLTLILTVLVGSASTMPGQAPTTLKSDIKSQDSLMESLGLITALQLYNTYLNIGLLADAGANEIYEPAALFQLLGSVVKPLAQVEKQLDKLSKLSLPKADLQSLVQLKKIVNSLQVQGKELELYWSTGMAENSKKYEAARLSAWKDLSQLLDLEPKKEKLPAPREALREKKP